MVPSWDHLTAATTKFPHDSKRENKTILLLMQNQLRVVDNSDMIRHQAWLIKPNYFPIEQNTVLQDGCEWKKEGA